ncbi:hypothetical protein BH10ACT7_BH10ACT7_19050 [soil metagenome]
MPAVTLTLLSKPDCHLCDDARGVIASVVEQLGERASVRLDELSILDDAELNARYWDEIPVVLVNGTVHTIWRVDPVRLRAAIDEAAG